MTDTHAWQYSLGQELRVNILARGVDSDGRHDMVEAFMLPDSATPPHLHTRYEERLYLVDGELTVWVGEEKRVLGPSDFVDIRLNVPHMIRAGSRGARTVLVSSPAGFAELIERTATRTAASGANDGDPVEDFVTVAEELGDVFLGPPGMTPKEAENAARIADG